MSAMITVMRDRYVRSWPLHADGEQTYAMDLGAALERAYKTDAHMACYVPARARRLASDALAHGETVRLTAVVLDVDCPAVHGSPEPAPESWRKIEREKVVTLNADHPGVYYYETRGGYRIVYRQPEPTVLRTRDDARDWSRAYAIVVAHLSRVYGIDADLQCSDWTRLYRLPRATRTPDGSPENWPCWGIAEQIGTLRIAASAEDVERACPAPVVRPMPAATVRASGTDAATRLSDERELVRTAPSGHRNRQLNRSAYVLSRLVRAGQLSDAEVYRELHGAARAAGLGEREIASTLASGLGAGLRGAA